MGNQGSIDYGGIAGTTPVEPPHGTVYIKHMIPNHDANPVHIAAPREGAGPSSLHEAVAVSLAGSRPIAAHTGISAGISVSHELSPQP